MSLYVLYRKLANENLQPICAHLAEDEFEARRRGEVCGCVEATGTVIAIDSACIHEVAPAPA